MIVPSICDISDWHNKVVLVRASLNVPITQSNQVADDYRIERLLPTLHYLVDQDAKVIIIGHIGRDKQDSLEVVHQRLKQDIDLEFFKDFFAHESMQSIDKLSTWIDNARPGEVVLLDNVRAAPGEYENDEVLAQQIAQIVDVYVNEAFAASHRSHMSLQALPRLATQAVAGFGCLEEVEELEVALSPRIGSVAIIGGNKVATKLPLIKQLLDSYQAVYVGGVLANTLYKLAGYEIGRSVHEDDLDEATTALAKDLLNDSRVVLPKRVVCEDATQANLHKAIQDVSTSDAIYDVDPEDIAEFMDTHREAPLVVWNGPLGYLEGGYTKATNILAGILRAGTSESIVGGGNTVDVLRDHNLEEGIDFLSTGGGAMVHYLTYRTLPALEALHR